MTTNSDHPLAALFAEHSTPKHVAKSAVHDALRPILSVGSLIQQQLIEYRGLVTAAELADQETGDGTMAAIMEHVHQTLRRAEMDAAEFVAKGRALGITFAQLDRYLTERKQVLANDAAAAS